MRAFSLMTSVKSNFLGHAPGWYKVLILTFLVINPLILITAGPFLAGWALMMEFVFTLAMALKCYPLQPGGLLAMEAVLMGLTGPARIYEETVHNFPVLLLLIFMVAGIYFMKELLLFIFSNIIIRIKNKTALSLIFCGAGAALSAFLDALTVMAVMMTVAEGFFGVYHAYLSERGMDKGEEGEQERKKDLEDFREFLQNIMMHGAIGTALGGVLTLVGEPQNLMIAGIMGWSFTEFFIKMAPVTIPILIAGLLTCFVLEKFALFGYGRRLPDRVRNALEASFREEVSRLDDRAKTRLMAQAAIGGYLVIALGFHLAEVGIIGLSVIVLLTVFNGVIEENQVGKAFHEALPFTSLLVVFFAVVAMINDQGLFKPIVDWTLSMSGNAQLLAFYTASGILSMVSDNVFVATVYMTEAKKVFEAALVTREQYDLIAVAINVGTNIPSVATPNGQAAFLFLLTSSLAVAIKLSYVRMLILAAPYTVVLTATGFVMMAVAF